jgi:hypothetical protein
MGAVARLAVEQRAVQQIPRIGTCLSAGLLPWAISNRVSEAPDDRCNRMGWPTNGIGAELARLRQGTSSHAAGAGERLDFPAKGPVETAWRLVMTGVRRVERQIGRN